MHSHTLLSASFTIAVLLTSGVVSLAHAAPPVTAAQQRQVIYVASESASPGDGSARRPFNTLEQARDAVRAARTRGQQAEVLIRGGTYTLREPLTLAGADSGTAGAPVVWRAATAKDTVRIIGGRMVRGLQPVADNAILSRLVPEARRNVMTLDLRAQGITDYGDPTGGFSMSNDTGMELFVDDAPLWLARYPNKGYIRITDVLGKTPFDANGMPATKEGVFRTDDTRMQRWVGEKDPRVFGYWCWDWADQRQKVASLEVATKTITLSEPWHQFGYRKGQYFYAYNLLSEIDQPGEWYLDRDTGKLYVWPATPSGKPPARVMVSLLPSIVRLQGAKYVTFRGLTFEGARGNAVEMNDSQNCSLVACTLRNVGKWAVNVQGGSDCVVRGCEVTGTGEGGVALNGGDRAKLTPSGHLVENCHIHDYSRWVRTYQPGVRMEGVGCRAVRNLIHDAPHQAFSIAGNDHLVEGNEVHNVCEESNDAGALYGWNDWAARGNVIRNNWFHHIYGYEGRGANGVYLDDNFSSALIENNIFQSVERAIHLGGGRDHQVLNNLFVDCPNALHIDARGLGWRASGFEELKKKLEAQPYRTPPWSTRYPTLVTLLDKEPMAPVGIRVAGNVFVGDRWKDIENKAEPYVTLTNNLTDADTTVLSRANQAVPRLGPEAAKKIGFLPLAYDKIGLYPGVDRALWPVRHPVTVREPALPGNGQPPHPLAATPLKVMRVRTAPKVDGRVGTGEYPASTISLAETPGRDKLRTPPASARLASDGHTLYIAITIPLAQVAKLQKSGSWGGADGIEIDFRQDSTVPKPIYILQGFPDGRLLTSLDGGASAAKTNALRAASRFVATVDGNSWTGEFAIDLTAAAVPIQTGTVLGLNLGVRRTETDDWIAWTGTGGPNWQLSGAGRIVLP